VIALAAHVGWRGALLAMGGAGLAVTLAVTVGLGGAGRVRAPAVGDKATPAGTAAPRLAGDVRLLLTAPIILAFAYFALQAGANLGVTAFSVPALVMIYDVPIIFAASAVTGYLLGSAGAQSRCRRRAASAVRDRKSPL
jgi:hypothetical protein